MKTIIKIFFLNLICYSIVGQETCEESFLKILHYEKKSENTLKRNYLPISLRIIKSKNYNRKALNLAYQQIQRPECDKYSQLVDKIIRFELKFDHKERAIKIAEERLNKIYPNWKNVEQNINGDHISILASIGNINETTNYYNQVRKAKGPIYFCDSKPYHLKVKELYESAQILYDQYGEIYSLKYLQNNSIIINENDVKAIKYWNEIFELLIKSIKNLKIESNLETVFLNSKILSTKDQNSTFEIISIQFSNFFKESDSYFMFYGVPIFYQKNTKNNQSPENLIQIKQQSNLLKLIKKYES